MSSSSRKLNHAKTFMWKDYLILAWFTRDEKDRLCVNLQAWVDSDEQVQARLTPDSDEDAQIIFDNLGEEAVVQSGMAEVIGECAQRHSEEKGEDNDDFNAEWSNSRLGYYGDPNDRSAAVD